MVVIALVRYIRPRTPNAPARNSVIVKPKAIAIVEGTIKYRQKILISADIQSEKCAINAPNKYEKCEILHINFVFYVQEKGGIYGSDN